MDINGFAGSRRFAIAAGAAAALAVGLVATAGPVGASPPTSARVAGDTLVVTGSSRADRVALRLDPADSDTLQVDFGDDGVPEHAFLRSTFSRIEVYTRGGDDAFRVDQANGVFGDEALTVDGGSGDDMLNGGDGAELFVGRGGNDAVDGNRGNDTGILGSGQDSFRWDPGDGSDVVEGRGGTDTLDFNGAGVDEKMSLSAEGERSVFLRDVANIRMDMDGVERLDLTALGGADTMTVGDMTGTDFRRADVDLSAPTGGADGVADTVTVNGTPRGDDITVAADGATVEVSGLRTATNVTGSEPIDLLQVKAQAGDDDVDVDPAALALIGVAVDLGPGEI